MNKNQREFCQKVNGFGAELASAQQADLLGKQIGQLKKELSTTETMAAHSEADPQAAVLAKLLAFVGLTNIKVDDVQTSLTIFVALLLEVGSGFGLYVACSQWRMYDRVSPPVSQMVVASAVQPARAAVPSTVLLTQKPAAIANDNKSVSTPRMVTPDDDVERYRKERIDHIDGSSLTATTLYEDYCAWCEEQRKEPLALPTFGRELGELGVPKAKIAGRVRYIGIALKAVHPREEDSRLPVSPSKAA